MRKSLSARFKSEARRLGRSYALFSDDAYYESEIASLTFRLSKLHLSESYSDKLILSDLTRIDCVTGIFKDKLNSSISFKTFEKFVLSHVSSGYDDINPFSTSISCLACHVDHLDLYDVYFDSWLIKPFISCTQCFSNARKSVGSLIFDFDCTRNYSLSCSEKSLCRYCPYACVSCLRIVLPVSVSREFIYLPRSDFALFRLLEKLNPCTYRDPKFCDLLVKLKEYGKFRYIDCPNYLDRCAIYAPPCSGKSEFSQHHLVDTDFACVCHSKILVTNRPDIAVSCKFSIWILPKLSTFVERCRRRGLKPQKRWYCDLLCYADRAQNCLIIYSDHYVGQVLTQMSDDISSEWKQFIEHLITRLL